jgi:hypothetical protein
MRLLYRLLMSGGYIGPAINLDLNFTSSLDSRVTFTRAGTRNYVSSGVLTALGTGQPAFESWNGTNYGMAIEPAFTNSFTYSNDFTQAVYTKTAGTLSAGDAGVGLAGAFTLFNSTVTGGAHRIYRPTTSQTAGTTQTFGFFLKAAAGATNYSVRFRISNEFNNNGPRVCFRIDGSDGFYPVLDTSVATNVTYGYRKLSGNIYQVWITATWVSTGNKEIEISAVQNSAPDTLSFTAATTDSFQIFGLSFTNSNGPVGYVATAASTASQAAESAVFNNTSWLTSTSQGTFLIEHDCWSGTLIGSGSNTVLSASVPGKTAIAWSGVTSDTVNNGGSSSVGVQPTFSGSDVRLLSTSGASNTGHIKSIRFYPSRLTVAELQALTSPIVASTSTPGALRSVSVDNRLPSAGNVTSGSALTFKSRFRVKLGAFPCSELRLDFPNIRWAAQTAVGNSLSITSAALERVTGVSEFAPIRVGGSRSFTVADGANTTVVSDAILPSAFTGLTEFSANMEFWVRVEGSVSSAGQIIVGSRAAETSSFLKIYNPATVTYSAIDSTGPIIYVSGTDVGSLSYGYCPILIGKFVSGDPKTIFVIGDSIIEGTGSIGATGNFVRIACRNLGLPLLEMSLGGIGQNQAEVNTANWVPYLKYSRVLIDELGTNSPNATLAFFSYWTYAKATYAMDKIVKLGLFPRSTSSDSFSTEINQSVARIYPGPFPDIAGIEWLKYGVINTNIDPQSVRGVDKAKWLTNGTAFYSTSDGTHQSNVGNDLLASEIQPIINSINVTV